MNATDSQTKFKSRYFLEVIDKLPHSKSRVPYTYHHDYLRQHSAKFSGKSRGEVACAHDSSDEELYAICLVQILNELGTDAIPHLDNDGLSICKTAILTCNLAMNRYN